MDNDSDTVSPRLHNLIERQGEKLSEGVMETFRCARGDPSTTDRKYTGVTRRMTLARYSKGAPYMSPPLNNDHIYAAIQNTASAFGHPSSPTLPLSQSLPLKIPHSISG